MDFLIVELLMIISIVLTLGAQIYVSSSYKKYSKIRNTKNMNGATAARILLDKNGLNNVGVEEIGGHLSDHYDPRTKTVRLSTKVYNEPSVASVAVACHECGHAIQDKDNYFFLRIRSSIVPFANVASYLGYFAILIGCFTGILDLILVGIIAEMVILLFQLVTLPVEINASIRALKQIKETNILENKEYKGGRVMLTAAALTYVASLATTILQILRLVIMVRNRD